MSIRWAYVEVPREYRAVARARFLQLSPGNPCRVVNVARLNARVPALAVPYSARELCKSAVLEAVTSRGVLPGIV